MPEGWGTWTSLGEISVHFATFFTGFGVREDHSPRTAGKVKHIISR